ncbi:hypothetical protein ACFW5X_04955 [Streptomyces albogriseolus]|uniref:hypothetical protein n=1 Tax=Streptomyces TaxID=1883 RepID=UPI0036BEFB6A
MDGSSASMRALDWAADEAALHGLPLRILSAAVLDRAAVESGVVVHRRVDASCGVRGDSAVFLMTAGQ